MLLEAFPQKSGSQSKPTNKGAATEDQYLNWLRSSTYITPTIDALWNADA